MPVVAATLKPSCEAIAAVLRAASLRYGTERILQDGIDVALAEAGFEVHREVNLTIKDRVDFLVSSVGIEVKIGGTLNDAIRQLHRYAASERVGELLLVTSRMMLARVPSELDGKPVRAVYVGSAF